MSKNDINVGRKIYLSSSTKDIFWNDTKRKQAKRDETDCLIREKIVFRCIIYGYKFPALDFLLVTLECLFRKTPMAAEKKTRKRSLTFVIEGLSPTDIFG